MHHSLLSPKEVEIVLLFVTNLNRKQIAVILGISLNTLNTHIKRIYSKTGKHNMLGLYEWAIENGLKK